MNRGLSFLRGEIIHYIQFHKSRTEQECRAYRVSLRGVISYVNLWSEKENGGVGTKEGHFCPSGTDCVESCTSA